MQVKIYSCSNCVDKNTEFIKYGRTSSGKQRYQCISCKKTSVLHYTYNASQQNINHQIIRLTKEGLGIRSTARILNISTSTLLKRLITIADSIPPSPIPYHKTYELDELRFFTRKKKNPQWLVYALDKTSGKVVAFYIDSRNNRTLNAVVKTLLNSEAERIYTDKLKNYKYLIPEKCHSTKRYGTNAIERNNLNIRTFLRRFQRRTICFGRSIAVTSAILKIYFWL